MNKLISVLLVVLLVGTMLTGCGSNLANKKSEDELTVVTTIFPEYDWVREITKGNEHVDLTLLLDNGVDLHSFQPSADDIIKIGSCDVFVYVGGESDEWVEDALEQATNKDMVVVNLLEVLGDSVKEEELVEGMESEEEESEDEEEVEYDEHVWLSLKNAKVLCMAISEALSKADEAAVKTILFGDRFPFRYMADDYSLDYYAAFVGCSAESEASFETITFLAGKIDELGLTTILQIESANGRIAETIRDTTANKNQTILTMNSMQSITSKDVTEGVTYLTLSNDNLEVLKQALQ